MEPLHACTSLLEKLRFDGSSTNILELSARGLDDIAQAKIAPQHRPVLAIAFGTDLCYAMIDLADFPLDEFAEKYSYVARVIGSTLLLGVDDNYYANDFYGILKRLETMPHQLEADYVGTAVFRGLINSVTKLASKKKKTKQDQRVLDKLYGHALWLASTGEASDKHCLKALHSFANTSGMYFGKSTSTDYCSLVISCKEAELCPSET